MPLIARAIRFINPIIMRLTGPHGRHGNEGLIEPRLTGITTDEPVRTEKPEVSRAGSTGDAAEVLGL